MPCASTPDGLCFETASPCLAAACRRQVQVVFQAMQNPMAGDEQLRLLIRSKTNIFLLFGGHGALAKPAVTGRMLRLWLNRFIAC